MKPNWHVRVEAGTMPPRFALRDRGISHSVMGRKVLLIGWDAADWEHITPLLEEGLMPTLDGLINRGVMGNLATLQPILSPMLWNSVATGKFADKHGIHGFIEPDPVNGGARPYSSASRKCKALWNILSQSGLTSNVIGWWASHPAEPIKGNVVTNAFGGVQLRSGERLDHPARRRSSAGDAAKSSPASAFSLTNSPRRTFFPSFPTRRRSISRKTSGSASFAKVLSDNASVHAVATALMEEESWDFTAVYYDGDRPFLARLHGVSPAAAPLDQG